MYANIIRFILFVGLISSSVAAFAVTHYIGSIADAMNAQPESIETNNVLAGTTIDITP